VIVILANISVSSNIGATTTNVVQIGKSTYNDNIPKVTNIIIGGINLMTKDFLILLFICPLALPVSNKYEVRIISIKKKLIAKNIVGMINDLFVAVCELISIAPIKDNVPTINILSIPAITIVLAEAFHWNL